MASAQAQASQSGDGDDPQKQACMRDDFYAASAAGIQFRADTAGRARAANMASQVSLTRPKVNGLPNGLCPGLAPTGFGGNGFRARRTFCSSNRGTAAAPRKPPLEDIPGPSLVESRPVRFMQHVRVLRENDQVIRIQTSVPHRLPLALKCPKILHRAGL